MVINRICGKNTPVFRNRPAKGFFIFQRFNSQIVVDYIRQMLILWITL